MIPAPRVAGMPNRRRNSAGDVGLVEAATCPVHAAAAELVSSACGTTVVGVSEMAAGRPRPTDVAAAVPDSSNTPTSQIRMSFAVVLRSQASAEFDTPVAVQA